MLVSREVRVCLADRDFENAKRQASRLGSGTFAVQVDVADWESQVAAFEKAVADFGRIDYVFPIAGIGERKVIKNDPKGQGFQKPDLFTIDVDLIGLLYTAYLAIQQMRRQEKDGQGYRGKSRRSCFLSREILLKLITVAVTASVCGLYCVPSKQVHVLWCEDIELTYFSSRTSVYGSETVCHLIIFAHARTESIVQRRCRFCAQLWQISSRRRHNSQCHLPKRGANQSFWRRMVRHLRGAKGLDTNDGCLGCVRKLS